MEDGEVSGGDQAVAAAGTKKKSKSLSGRQGQSGAADTALSPFIDRALLPGDQAIDLHSVVSHAPGERGAGGARGGAVLRLGSGLRQDGAHVVAMRAGVLRTVNNKKFWVESSLKRYTPAVEEEVVGIVVQKHAENFDVDIKGPSLALLPVLAFEGATRRNRPNIDIGAAVYARVVKTHHDAVPELACTDASGRASGFGPLVGGYIFETSSGLARMLLSAPLPGVLEALGGAVSFEMAVGLNGRVWVRGETAQVTILVVNAIQASEGKSSAQQKTLVKALLKATQRREG